MIKVGIVGASGYTGVELLRILISHPQCELGVVTSNSEKGKKVADVFPSLRSHIELEFQDHKSHQLHSCDVVFFATPHATAMYYVPEILEKGCKVIDLSADFRLSDPMVWQEWYGEQHACSELLKEAVYGLTELNRNAIKDAVLVANPGCYPTAISLALLPALQAELIDKTCIIADAKSGLSGAGRKAGLPFIYSEVSESLKAYSVSGHRHLPEMTQTLTNIKDVHVNITFVPHLVPVNRGILATLYVKQLDNKITMPNHYADFYSKEPFIDVMPEKSHPETRSVRGTNYCRISVHPATTQDSPAVILSVIDNLVKGAAGQAVQNMNLMFGLKETTGLLSPGLVP